MIDLLIKDGMVVDGLGGTPYYADVAVSDGRIAGIEPGISEEECRPGRILNAKGRCVTPGFIDIHRHADAAVFREGFGNLELHQGLTTIVNGNCGQSIFPCFGKYAEDIRAYGAPVLGTFPEYAAVRSFSEYRNAVKAAAPPLNIEMLIGNGTVCAAFCGYGSTPPEDEQIKSVNAYLEEAFLEGALGVSLGLGYTPECHYSKEMLIRLLEPMRGSGLPLTTHIRGEGDSIHTALREVITIAAELGIPLHVSHLKCVGKRNWGHGMEKSLSILDEAREKGIDATCDFYPYIAGSTQLMILLPRRFQIKGIEGLKEALRSKTAREEIKSDMQRPSKEFENIVELAGWENIILTSFSRAENQQYCGLNVEEIAAMRGQDPFDAAFDLLLEENCDISMIDNFGSEEDVRRVMTYPYSSIISDSTYPDEGIPHPRVYGSFTRILEKYVKEDKVISLQEAVKKMTSSPARVLNLRRKGILSKGMDADILVFDLDNIRAGADFENPRVLGKGFDYVIINGEVRLRDGQQ